MTQLLIKHRKHVPVVATFLVLCAIVVFASVRYNDRGFNSLYNYVSLLRGGAVIGIAAVGASFVIFSGGIDLSVGAVIALTSTLVATLVSPELGPGLHPLAAIAVGLAAGTLFGALQGCLIHFYALPPFLITLAGMFLARGLAFAVQGESVGIRHGFYYGLQQWGLPVTERVNLPLSVLVMFACYLLAVVVAHFTRFGRAVYAVGGDEPSARLMGVSVGRVKIGVYALAGFTAALAGVVATTDMYSGNPKGFEGYELDAISAVVIGGALLTGGVGLVAGTLLGVLILGLIRLVIDNEGTLSTWWTNISSGLLLFVFIAAQSCFVRATGSRGPRHDP